MAGSNLSAFTRFQDITGPTYYSGREECINDAQKTNYHTLGYLLRGQQMADILQGGADIRDNITLGVTRLTHSYKIGDSETYQMPQPTTTWRVPWRYWLTYLAWTDQQVELNEGGGDLTHVFKREWWKMQQEMWTDYMNYMEETYWAVPNKSSMESVDGQEQYSIPCFVNEHTNGLAAPGTANGGTWTTVQNVDPTAAGKSTWVPTQQAYTQLLSTTNSASAVAGLVSAFDKAYDKCDFQAPPMKAEYFESNMAQPQGFIACSLQGKANARFAYRDANDRWQDFWDPFGQPTYGGRPFVYVKQLDTAAIFPTGSAAAYSTELDTAGTTNAGPRYFGIMPKYLRSVFKNTRFMKDLGVMTDAKTPTTHARPFDNWGNLVCRSRARHFIIYPTADINNA